MKTILLKIQLIVCLFFLSTITTNAIEFYNRVIKTKYFDVVYNKDNWQLANYYANNVDAWAEDLFAFYGFKTKVRITVRIVSQTNTENANAAGTLINMYSSKVFSFHNPISNEWYEDTFKHELQHSMFALGDSGPLLVYSGIDQLVKYVSHVFRQTRAYNEGASVVAESHIGYHPQSGRLNGENYKSTIHYMVDKGYKIDFYRMSTMTGDYYLEGATFLEFIYQVYGKEKYTKTFNEWLTTYYYSFFYRLEDFFAKKLDTTTDKLADKYRAWLLDRSKEFEPKNKIVEGKELLGLNKTGALLKVKDGNLYFARLKATSSGITYSTTGFALNGSIISEVYKVPLAGEFKEGKKIHSFAVANSFAASNRIYLDNEDEVYYRTKGVENILGLGNYSYYIKKTPSYSIANNLGASKLLNTKGAMYLANTNKGIYIIRENKSQYTLVKLAENKNEEDEIVIAPEVNLTLGQLRYSSEDNLLVFSGSASYDTIQYIFTYNVITKELKKLTKGTNPYIANGTLYFISNRVGDERANVYAMNLSTNKIIKITNLKYAATDVVASDDAVYYTSLAGTADDTYNRFYELKKTDWVNTPADDLLVNAKAIKLEADTSDNNPTNIAEDKGKYLGLWASTKFTNLTSPDLLFSVLDGSFRYTIRSDDANYTLRLEIRDVRGSSISFDNINAWRPNGRDYNVSFKTFVQDRFRWDQKEIGFTLLGLQAGYSDSSPNALYQGFLSYFYRDKVSQTSTTKTSIIENTTQNVNKFEVSYTPMLISGYWAIPTVYAGTSYSFTSYTNKKVEKNLQGVLVNKDSKNNVIESIKPNVILDWQDFKIRSLTDYSYTLRNTETKYTAQNYEDKFVNKGRWSIEQAFVFADALRNFKLPYGLELPFDKSNVEIAVEYYYGNTNVAYNYTSINPSSQYLGKLSYSTPLYNIKTYVDTRNILNASSISFNNRTAKSAQYIDEYTHLLTMDTHKLYEWLTLAGSHNFGIRSIQLIPAYTTLWVWGNIEDKRNGQQLAEYKSFHQIFSLTAGFQLNFWRFEPNFVIKFYHKNTPLTVAHNVSGYAKYKTAGSDAFDAKTLAKAYSDYDRTVTGVTLFLGVRF